MAAALVMLTNWRKDRPFVDPVCGSGTLCIEAALIGHNIAPGFNRSFVCETWDWVPAEVFETVRAQADEAADYDRQLDIMGSDINGRMIEIAKANAEEIGLGDSITFKQQAVKDFKTDKEYGVIVANPPYGERLGEEETVQRLYREMGEVFRPLKTWSKYILTSDLTFETHYGEKATKKRKLYNGALRTDFFQYWGSRPPRKRRRLNERTRISKRIKRARFAVTSNGNPWLGYSDGMPEKASEYRSEVDSYLYGLYFEKKVGPTIQEAITYFGQHPDELSEVGQAAYQLVKEEYELQKMFLMN